MEFPPFTIRSKMSNYFRDNKLITFILMKNILFIKKSEVLFDKLKVNERVQSKRSHRSPQWRDQR